MEQCKDYDGPWALLHTPDFNRSFNKTQGFLTLTNADRFSLKLINSGLAFLYYLHIIYIYAWGICKRRISHNLKGTHMTKYKPRLSTQFRLPSRQPFSLRPNFRPRPFRFMSPFKLGRAAFYLHLLFLTLVAFV